MGKLLILIGLALVSAIAYQNIQSRHAAEQFAQWQIAQQRKQVLEEQERLAREAEYERQTQAQKQKQDQLTRKIQALRARESRKRLSKLEEHAGDEEFLQYLDHKDEIEAAKKQEDSSQAELDDFGKRMEMTVGAILESAREMGVTAPNTAPPQPAEDLEPLPNMDAVRAAEAFNRQFGSGGPVPR